MAKRKYSAQMKRAYGQYKRRYHEAIKGHQNQYMKRLSLKEFSEWYRDAKLAPASKDAPIKSIVEAQKFVESDQFIEYYKSTHGGRVDKDFKNARVREDVWLEFLTDRMAEGMTYTEAKAYAEEYFGY